MPRRHLALLLLFTSVVCSVFLCCYFLHICYITKWKYFSTAIKHRHAGRGFDSDGNGSKIKPNKVPLILLYHKLHGQPNWWFKTNEQDFMHCPIKCHVTSNRSLYADADMVMFEAPKSIKQRVGQTIILNYYRDWGEWPRFRGNNQQVRMFYAREPQLAGLSGRGLAFAEDMFNYTMTFQKEADIFYPYGHTRRLPQPNSITPTDYGASKNKLLLWMVSNCHSKKRMRYKEELSKYLQVDMYGKCNPVQRDPCKREPLCLQNMKRKYKFYLAFENHECDQYITEKFWRALNDSMVPIVMGGAKEWYDSVAPPYSYIHVDGFSSPKDLSKYLISLDKNNSLYNEYHHWRKSYGIAWENANCELCRLAAEKPTKVTKLSQFWNAEKQCKS